ncbi:MAG: pyruvate ferredoxin oxidoreductase [Chloroflexi bacterium]|nr:pyruvate ferredoxin oxidoreductase [Chloroflexota bacterium]
MKKVMEGSLGVANAVRLCKPQMIAAYPITPQTHIVEGLAKMVADGNLDCHYVNVESEHSAASVTLGAAAAGVRVFTASSSQGIMLMAEVIFNIGSIRLPIVMVCVNRALSFPINIWNDQQDSFAVRDAGWIQLYAEDNQEATDMIFQAYRLAEDHRVSMPVMVCLDGFILSHAFEPLDLPEQAQVEEYLPPYKPIVKLDPENPLTMGVMGGPEVYMEMRKSVQDAMIDAMPVIEEVADEFKKMFGRGSAGLMEEYRMDDAELVILSMGSVLGTVKEVVDERREKGEKIGVLKLRCYRPFPVEQLRSALAGIPKVAVLEKDISLGYEGALFTDLKAALYNTENAPKISGFIAGLGGRDITRKTINDLIDMAKSGAEGTTFLDTAKEIAYLGGVQ